MLRLPKKEKGGVIPLGFGTSKKNEESPPHYISLPVYRQQCYSIPLAQTDRQQALHQCLLLPGKMLNEIRPYQCTRVS